MSRSRRHESSHQSLHQQARSPNFVPHNGCLPQRIDRATSLILLASYKAYESIDIDSIQNSSIAQSYDLFRSRVVGKLVGMGVKLPHLAVKQGGVGNDLLDSISLDFWRSNYRGHVACPGTVSIIGSLAAQECIKAMSSVHSPANQFLLFEALKALPPLNEDWRSSSHL